MSWPVVIGTRIIVWNPLQGLDPSLGEEAIWIGATVFAKNIVSKKPEAECHIAAEKAAYAHHYNVKYTSNLLETS